MPSIVSLEACAYGGVLSAVTRGGLIPAAIVARELDCRLVKSVSIVTYAGDSADLRTDPVVTKPPTAAGDGTGFLIVDDLVDTGTTGRIGRTLLPHAHFACVYAKLADRGVVDTSSPRFRKTRGFCSRGTQSRNSWNRWHGAGCGSLLQFQQSL